MHFSWEILVWKSKFWNTFFGARTQGGSSIFDQWPDYLFFGWKLNFFPLHIITHIFGRARLRGREAARPRGREMLSISIKKRKIQTSLGAREMIPPSPKKFFLFFSQKWFCQCCSDSGFWRRRHRICKKYFLQRFSPQRPRGSDIFCH